MKVALVHDYLREYGGAERVLETIHEMFPDAPVYTFYVNLEAMGENGKRFKTWDIRPSWFQKLPFGNILLSPFRIFGPMAFESFDLSDYDLVISSSSATHLAKAVITKPETLHISYIHTPPRFLYGYVTSFNYKKHWWTRIGGEIINHYMRIYDFEVSQRPDILLANSKNIAKRIAKFYRRDSVVVYPPVDLSEIKLQKKKEDYYLAINRLVRGKGTEVIVEACAKLRMKLKVAGSGPELAPLRERFAGFKNVEFLGWVLDAERVKLLQNAKALIVASEDEDFGITAIEAQAAGTPVISPRSGGFLETVIDGKTGLFYGGPGQVNSEALTDALKQFKGTKFNPEDLRKNAEKFSTDRFKKELLDLVDKNLKIE
ncbi:MAG: glycosyltransferase [Candidatus Daviesbacteria bacterium]|nr:glycosyltransferase [Candidatus Daviesbacteria bacterium]